MIPGHLDLWLEVDGRKGQGETDMEPEFLKSLGGCCNWSGVRNHSPLRPSFSPVTVRPRRVPLGGSVPLWRSKVKATMTETVVGVSAVVVEGAGVKALSCVLFGIQNIKCARDFSREFQSLEMREGKGMRIDS